MRYWLKQTAAMLVLVFLYTALPGGNCPRALADAESSPASGEHLCNAQRTGHTVAHLRPPFQLAWVYADRHKPRAAWKEPVWEPQRIDFDYAYAVSAGAGLVYVASSADHAVHALDLVSGQPRWKFFTDAPVRLAPSIDAGRIYFGSDDGFVYCLKGHTGELVS